MLREGQPNPVKMRTIRKDTTPVVPIGSIRIGPLQRLKSAINLTYIRQGTFLRIPPKPLWFEKGWQPIAATKQYLGQYQAAGHTWQGMLQEPYPGGYLAYIWHPPLDEIKRNTHHGPCFIPNGEAGRFQVYFHVTPSSLDHAITSIERVLTEACRSRS